MTQDRRFADYRQLEDVDAAIRRENGQASLTVGYAPGGGAATKAVPGDQKFPYFKDVPDVEGPVWLRDGFIANPGPPLQPITANPLPLVVTADDYETSPVLDVRGIRQVLVFARYWSGLDGDPLSGVGVLSVVPQAAFEPSPEVSQEWMPIGVVDPVLYTPAIEPGFAFRRVYSTELRYDPGYTPLGPQPYLEGPHELTLVFDVGPYDVFRLRYGDLVTASSSLYARAYRMR
jgi:hypothetical protein